MNPDTLHFKTIAVAIDLTESASPALRYAQTMARMYDSTLVLVHVIDPLAYAFPNGAPSLLSANTAAAAELKKIEEEASALGIPVHSVIESGIVCERILQVMSEHHADLLLLGTRAKTEAGRVAPNHDDLARCAQLIAVGRMLAACASGNRLFSCICPSPALRAPASLAAVGTTPCSAR
jgi:nucleotide-binding universal stress UspA family protein